MNKKAVICVLLLLICVASATQPQTKRNKASSVSPCPDQRAYTGEYRNLVFGFSIIIPAGLKGYWNSPRCVPDEKYGCVCMNDHGRFIPLSADASIEAFVGWEMESEWSIRDYENDEVYNLRKEKGIEQVKILGSTWTRLGNLKGRRFVVQFTEKDKNVVIDHIIAIYKGVEYELILQTPADRYQRDRREFEKVIASWRLTPRI